MMKTNKDQTNLPLCLPVFRDPQTMETAQMRTKIWPQTTSESPRASKDQVYDGTNLTF